VQAASIITDIAVNLGLASGVTIDIVEEVVHTIVEVIRTATDLKEHKDFMAVSRVKQQLKAKS
jgi:hypothetical protein